MGGNLAQTRALHSQDSVLRFALRTDRRDCSEAYGTGMSWWYSFAEGLIIVLLVAVLAVYLLPKK